MQLSPADDQLDRDPWWLALCQTIGHKRS
jgi:hypothetical protein